MRKIDRYNDYIFEKEFDSIIEEIFRIVENQTGSNTFEWDIEPKNKKFNIKDKNEFEVGDTVEFDMEEKKLKDYTGFIKNKIKSIKDLDLIPFDKIEKFLKKLVDNTPKENLTKKVKMYFDKFISELKSIPSEIRKSIIKKSIYLFMSIIPITSLITDLSVKNDPILREIKVEIEKPKPEVSSFEIAQNGVHRIEGVYTDDRDDKGNWTGNEIGVGELLGTKFGIAAPTLVQYYQSNDLGKPTKSDMENLTYKLALKIYKKDYWEKQKLENFKSQSLANVLYDGCVNQGPRATFDILKKSLNDIKIDTTNINTWNDFHDVLIDYVNELPEKKIEKLFNTIKNKRWEKYQLGKKKYIDGWKNRLDAITFIDNKKDLDIT